MKLLAVSLICLVSAANAAIKEKELSWQLPDPGSHTYDVVYSSTENKAGKDKKLHMQYKRVIETHKTDKGFTQIWIDSEPVLEFKGYEIEEQTLFSDFANSTKGLNIKVALSKDGYYESIQNIAEISTAIKKQLERTYIAAQTKALEKVAADKRDAAKLEADKRSAGMLAAVTSPEFLQKQFEKIPFAYNFFNGGGLDSENAYELDDFTSNPFGGEPFPISIHFEINLDKDDPGYVYALYQSTFNQDKGRAILIAAIKKIDGQNAPDSKYEELLKEFALTTEVNLRISLETGLVHEMTYVETKQFPNSLEIESTTVTLDATTK